MSLEKHKARRLGWEPIQISDFVGVLSHDSSFRRWERFQCLYFGYRMKPGPQSSRICRMANRASHVWMTGLSSPAFFMFSRPGAAGAMCRLRMGRRRQSTTATTDGPGAAYGSVSSRKWRRQVLFPTNCRSTALTSRHIVQRLAQKGGIRGSDWPLAWRKNKQDPCFGR